MREEEDQESPGPPPSHTRRATAAEVFARDLHFVDVQPGLSQPSEEREDDSNPLPTQATQGAGEEGGGEEEEEEAAGEGGETGEVGEGEEEDEEDVSTQGLQDRLNRLRGSPVPGGGGAGGGGGGGCGSAPQDHHDYARPDRGGGRGGVGRLNLPTMREVSMVHIPTLTHIPKRVRGTYATAYGQVLRKVTETKSEEAFIMLGMFAKVIVPAVKDRRTDTIRAARNIEGRIARWRNGDFQALWEEAQEMTGSDTKGRKRGRRKRQTRSQEEINADRAKKLARVGQLSRACQALSSTGMAEQSAETTATLRSKHPGPSQEEDEERARRESERETLETPPMQFDRAQVKKGIKSFKRGSAPGLDGCRAEHLQAMVGNMSSGWEATALGNITNAVNTLVGGDIPEEVRPYFFGARLHGALKKDGGIRPIAVCGVLRRLVSKLMAFSLNDRAAARLAPHQMGVGSRGGAEAVIHALRRTLQADQTLLVLQVDLDNAFGRANREAAFVEVRTHFPDCWGWVKATYLGPTCMVFGKDEIWSEVGFHQGCPMSPLLFSLSLQKVVDRIQELRDAEGKELAMHAWYLDDGVFVGTKEMLGRVVDIIEEEGPGRGLILSKRTAQGPGKSTVWSPAGLEDTRDPIGRNIPGVGEEGIVLLGAPVGTTAFQRTEIRRRVDKIKTLTGKLATMEDSHLEFVLLRNCLQLPKLVYVLRTVDPSAHKEEWVEYDEITRKELGRILAGPISHARWATVALPASMGGAPMRAAVDHAGAAYTASALGYHNLVRDILGNQDLAYPEIAEDIRIALSLALELEDTADEATLAHFTQRELSLAIDKRALHLAKMQAVKDGDKREVVRLAALALPHAGTWLSAVPNPALGMHLTSQEFVLAMRYRLGLPIYREGAPCWKCGTPMDALGDHAHHCSWGVERTDRHNAVRDVFYRVAEGAGLSPRKEVRKLLASGDKRPGDVLLPGYPAGTTTAYDFTLTSPFQAKYLDGEVREPGHAINEVEVEKVRKHGRDCAQAGLRFVPVGFHTLGGISRGGLGEVKGVAGAMARSQGEDDSQVILHCLQRMSMAIQRGNSAMLAARVDTLDQEVDGVQEDSGYH